MKMMPAGKYLLVGRDEVRWDGLQSKSTIYYPGVRDRERAIVIPIEPGKYSENLDIRLPSDEKRYKIAGRLQFADGVPAPRATVAFTSPQHGYLEVTETRPDGSFGLSSVAGMNGQLHASIGILDLFVKTCPEFKVGPRKSGIVRFIDSNLVPLSVDSDQVGLNLTLNSPSCKLWPPKRNQK